MALPPGPRRPAIVQIVQWASRPLPLMDECVRRFGDIFTLRLAGLGDAVLVNAPELIKTIFTADPKVLHAGESNEILRPVVGKWSVLLLDEAAHLRQRRLLLPPFHGERMQAYAEQMRDITEARMATWSLGRPFAMHPEMQAITLDVILRAVFGLAEGAQMKEFAADLVALFHPPPALLIFVPRLHRDAAWNPYRSFYRRREVVYRKIHAIIAERRRAPDLATRADILSLLLQARDEEGHPMTDEEVRDELVTMIAAGHETTATSLAWAFERLLALPDVAAKVDAELRAVTGGGRVTPAMLPRLEYLDAVVKETLRIRPILPIVIRRVKAPFHIGGYDLPAGSMVGASIYLTHRREDLYPDPERFAPERWLGDKKLDPYAYLPFGGGTRRCIGMAFAVYEMKIILATVLNTARLRLPGGAEPVARRGITLAPREGTRVVMDRAA